MLNACYKTNRMEVIVDEKITQINDIFNEKISSLSLDELRERGRANNMTGLTQYNKPKMRELLVSEFQQGWALLKDMKLEELRIYARENKFVGFSAVNKNELVLLIMGGIASSDDRLFATFKPTQNKKNSDDKPDDKKTEYTDDDNTQKDKVDKKKEDTDDKKPDKDDAVKKDKVDKKKEDADDKPKKDKVDKKNDEIKRIEDRLEEIEKNRMEELKGQEEEDKKKKKQTIPKSVRTHVWDLYIGSHINEHRCVCCKKTLIKITCFDVGHVMSERDGGTLEISNLRPICAVCNHSMGTMNMVDYVKKYGYYIG